MTQTQAAFTAARERIEELEETLRNRTEALREIRDRGTDESSTDQFAYFPRWAKEVAARALTEHDSTEDA